MAFIKTYQVGILNYNLDTKNSCQKWKNILKTICTNLLTDFNGLP